MKTKICSFEGCGRPHFAHTLCHAHYEQRRRGNDELRPLQRRRPKGVHLERDEYGRKFCIWCELWVHESEFQPDPRRPDRLTVYCKPCRSAKFRAWRYGLTSADLARMIHSQDGRCATCPAPLAEGYCVDHDHSCCPDLKTCGRCIRGLLCQECNKLIGKLEGDPDRLARMLAYMKGDDHG